VAALVAAATAVGLFLLFDGGGGGGPAAVSSRAVSFYDSQKASPVLLSRYGDLLSHRVSPESLPANFADHRLVPGMLGPRFGAQLGLDTSEIGEAEPFPGTKIWLIPGTRGDCFVVRKGPHGGSGQCGPIGRSEFGPAGIGSGPEREEADGLVPDGIHHITVHLVGGGKLVEPVKDNFYEFTLRIGQQMTSLSAITRSGRAAKLATGLAGS
jgi:hypothetical protein